MAEINKDNPSPSPKFDDGAVFTELVAVLRLLDPDARLRMFRTLATFFDISAYGISSSSARPIDIPKGAVNTPVSLGATFSEDRSVTPKQFLFEKRPVTDMERVACLAYYLTHYRDTPHFKTLDISKLNTEAAQIKFSNPTKSVDNAMQRGLLAQAGKAQKQISSLGELYVQALPDRDAARQAIAHSRPRKLRLKNRQIKNTED